MNASIACAICLSLGLSNVQAHALNPCYRLADAIEMQTPDNACWRKASSQAEMNECAAQDLKNADAELNKMYAQVISKYSKDATAVARIKKAQRAWIMFRDAQIDASFPEVSRGDRGSVFPMCRASELAALTAERTKALEALVKSREGDVCSPAP